MAKPSAVFTPDKLQAGDCLLYRPKGIFGQLIRIKTWHKISHVEVYAGNGMSYASRDGLGVNLYPVRLSELAWVLRPSKLPANITFSYAKSMIGTPYGWLDLLAFIGLPVNFPGIVCSAFATNIYRTDLDWPIFPTDTATDIAPFEFLTLVGNGFNVIYQA